MMNLKRQQELEEQHNSMSYPTGRIMIVKKGGKIMRINNDEEKGGMLVSSTFPIMLCLNFCL